MSGISAVKAEATPAYYYAGPQAMAYELDFSHREIDLDGPTGGGKTFASARKCLNATLKQKPSTIDGVRRAKIVVVCPSYQIMEDTVVASFKKVHRTEGRGCNWQGSPRRQQTFDFKGALSNGAKIDMKVDFRAVTDLDYDTFFRGLECTGFWTPEADTVLNREIRGYFANRFGREYLQHVADGEQLAWFGRFGDSNVPFIGTYFHDLHYLKLDRKEQEDLIRSGGAICYHQPPGYDPESPDGWPRDPSAISEANPTGITAENWFMLMRKDPEAYKTQARDMEDEAMVRRLLMCQPMPQRFGLPVHDAFDANYHCTSMRLTPERDKRVIVGIDGTGLCPAAVFYQRLFNGQWRAFKEFAPLTHQYDSVDFGHHIKRILEDDFGGAPGGVIGCFDPASLKRAQHDKRFEEWQIIQRAAGIPMIPAPTNEHNARKTALDRLLKDEPRVIGSKREPTLLISRDGCPNFIRGLAGGYSYKKRKDKLSPEIDKDNPLTNVVEAGQYAPLTIEGIDGKGGMFSAHGNSAPRGPVQVTRKQRQYS